MTCKNLDFTLDVSKTNPGLGETVTCVVTVSNTGTTCEPFSVAFHEKDTDPFFTSPVQKIAPREIKKVSVSFKVTEYGKTMLYANLICNDDLPKDTVVGRSPVAGFTLDRFVGKAPLRVSFKNLTTGAQPISYEWDFWNDGTVDSTLENPVNIYPVGTYSVKLTAKNKYGETFVVKSGIVKSTL